MVAVAAFVIIVIGALFYRSLAAVPFALGVLITSGLNVLKLRMLERTVLKVVDMDDRETGKNYVRIQYLLRYFLTAIVLVAIGLIHNYTTPPPIYSSRDSFIGVWAALFPNGPEALLGAPLISLWGALAGIFTMQLSVILVRSMKLEKDGDNFIAYDDNISKDEDDVSSAKTDNSKSNKDNDSCKETANNESNKEDLCGDESDSSENR